MFVFVFRGHQNEGKANNQVLFFIRRGGEED